MSDHVPVISYPAELRRKALHLGALVVPLAILWLGRDVLWLFVPGAVLAVVGDVARARSAGARAWLHNLFGGLMRPEEMPPLDGPVTLNGATWMTIAAALCTALFSPPVAAAALAMQMVGDGAAAVVGRRFGQNRWPGSYKSVEGSIAMAVSAWGIGLAVGLWPGAGLTPAVLAVGAVVAAVAEAIPIPLNDNVRVPLAAGLAMALLVA